LQRIGALLERGNAFVQSLDDAPACGRADAELERRSGDHFSSAPGLISVLARAMIAAPANRPGTDEDDAVRAQRASPVTGCAAQPPPSGRRSRLRRRRLGGVGRTCWISVRDQPPIGRRRPRSPRCRQAGPIGAPVSVRCDRRVWTLRFTGRIACGFRTLGGRAAVGNGLRDIRC
jgi:hypothetical protein